MLRAALGRGFQGAAARLDAGEIFFKLIMENTLKTYFLKIILIKIRTNFGKFYTNNVGKLTILRKISKVLV